MTFFILFFTFPHRPSFFFFFPYDYPPSLSFSVSLFRSSIFHLTFNHLRSLRSHFLKPAFVSLHFPLFFTFPFACISLQPPPSPFRFPLSPVMSLFLASHSHISTASPVFTTPALSTSPCHLWEIFNAPRMSPGYILVIPRVLYVFYFKQPRSMQMWKGR